MAEWIKVEKNEGKHLQHFILNSNSLQNSITKISIVYDHEKRFFLVFFFWQIEEQSFIFTYHHISCILIIDIYWYFLLLLKYNISWYLPQHGKSIKLNYFVIKIFVREVTSWLFKILEIEPVDYKLSVLFCLSDIADKKRKVPNSFRITSCKKNLS